MKGSYTNRLLIAAAVIGLTYGAMHLLDAGIKPSEVIFPAWVENIFDKDKGLPMQLGPWSGQKSKLDSAIFVATGAKTAEDRIYTDDIGRYVSMHIAIFDNPDEGLNHTPFNCYEAKGYRMRLGKEESLPSEQTPKPLVYLSKWDREGMAPCYVVHWYQLGDATIFDRWDLGKARFALRKWPPLIKVLIQINGTSDDDKELILNYSKLVYSWLNQPSHIAETSAAVGSKTIPPAESEKSAEPKNPSPKEKTE